MRLRSLAPAARPVVGFVALALVLQVPEVSEAAPAAAAAAPATRASVPASRANGSTARASARRSSSGGATSLVDVIVAPLQSTAKRTPVQAGVRNPRGQHVTLQRLDRGRWTTVRSRTAPRTGSVAWVALALPAKAGDVRYRVVVPTGRTRATAAVRAFSVFQSDARKHARYITKARSYVARYCPSTPIYIDTPSIGPRTAGVATTTVVGPFAPPGKRKATRMRWEQAIELRSGMSTSQLRHAALHECAHIVQARPLVAGAKAAAKRQKITEKRYGAKGAAAAERQADCMATALTGSSRHLYYVPRCTRAQLADARAMWRGYGTKHRSPTLTWTARR